jgi:hypothetical protein
MGGVVQTNLPEGPLAARAISALGARLFGPVARLAIKSVASCAWTD